MCMFCAAIPMSVTAAAALAGKQTEKRQQAEAKVRYYRAKRFLSAK